MTLTAEKPTPLRRNRDFGLLWIGAGFNMFGLRITAIGYPILVLWYTGSATQAGLVSAAALLPHLLVQLPAGAYVDRWDRRRLMVICDAGCLIATGSVALAVLLDRIWLPHLIVAAFTQASLIVFYQLAERAAVRHLVPGSQLSSALTQNEARSRAAMLLGQPIGAALFAVVRWFPFGLTALAHLVSLVALLLIRKPFQLGVPRERRSLAAEVGEGIAWVWREKFLRTVMVFVAISNVPFQGLGLAILVVVEQDGGSAALIGVIIAISGLGGMLGALNGTWWLRTVSLRNIVVGGLVVWTLVMPLMALTRNPFLLGGLFAVSSYIGGLFNVAGGVYMVRITPDEIMGRVGSVATLLGSGTNFLGVLAAGFLLDRWGVSRTVLMLSAVMVFLVVASVVSPSVRNVADTRERHGPE